MHPLAKLLIGIVLLLVPLGLYAYEYTVGAIYPRVNLLSSLWTVIQGIIPPFLMVIGLFIIWLELDEWRIEKELKEEEEKEKKKKKGKKEEKGEE
jgi:predicted tellurium resistance membrane protein TerC